MTDIRIREKPFEYNGKTYMLRCNFNVLADMQAYHNGNLMSVLYSPDTLHVAKEFLAFMLNDYAQEMKWQERYTPSDLGRHLSPDPTVVNGIVAILHEIVYPAISGDAQNDESQTDTDGISAAQSGETEKNEMTMQD